MVNHTKHTLSFACDERDGLFQICALMVLCEQTVFPCQFSFATSATCGFQFFPIIFWLDSFSVFTVGYLF